VDQNVESLGKFAVPLEQNSSISITIYARATGSDGAGDVEKERNAAEQGSDEDGSSPFGTS
jgi:hypothetical protein